MTVLCTPGRNPASGPVAGRAPPSTASVRVGSGMRHQMAAHEQAPLLLAAAPKDPPLTRPLPRIRPLPRTRLCRLPQPLPHAAAVCIETLLKFSLVSAPRLEPGQAQSRQAVLPLPPLKLKDSKSVLFRRPVEWVLNWSTMAIQ